MPRSGILTGSSRGARDKNERALREIALLVKRTTYSRDDRYNDGTGAASPRCGRSDAADPRIEGDQ